MRLIFTGLVVVALVVSASPISLVERVSCSDGEYQCTGNVLQECSQQVWLTIEDCSTNNLVCSATSSETGCTWPSKNSTSSSSDTLTATSSSSSASASAPASVSTSGTLPAGLTGSITSVASSKTASGAFPTTTGSSNSSGNGTTYTGTWSAPHYSIYADAWLTQPPDVSSLGSFNRFILSFWMHSGPVDDAQAWQELDSSTRSSILSSYHSAGIALMVSAFGSTDTPTSSGADPTNTAQNLAAFVKQYQFDGVDIDYEDFTAFNGGTAEAWLITPWFSTTAYPAGGYSYIYSKVPDIDFFNVQFYSQGTLYTDCTSLISDSGASNGTESFPGTSLLEINSNGGVPLDKLVLGKPLTPADATNGYVAPSTLAGCVSQAKSKNWNGGIMFWQWHAADDPATILSTVIGG